MADAADINTLRLSTRLLHADLDGRELEVSPPISTTTTFRQPIDPASAAFLQQDENLPTSQQAAAHIYSRDSAPTRARVETLLGSLENACAVTYSSGLSALYAAKPYRSIALLHFQPCRVAVREGYHGTHEVIRLYARGRGDKSGFAVIDIDDEFTAGDLVMLETPKNPRGEVADVRAYSKRAHECGARVLVDATLAPPPLQYPLDLGCDVVMHSSTKYLGGHSDLLAGVLMVRDKQVANALAKDRTNLGSVMGNLETWLLLRSLRTLTVRVTAQSSGACKLVSWLHSLKRARDGADKELAALVHAVHHASLLTGEAGAVAQAQMPGGWSPVFSVELCTEQVARAFPYLLRIMQPATSLGGVESLIEWRRQCDPHVSPLLLRVSVGLEDPDDLINDWRQALQRANELMATQARSK
ncbi:hypothetical protein RI367_004228 [Sorochytrium milnesiophthora]